MHVCHPSRHAQRLFGSKYEQYEEGAQFTFLRCSAVFIILLVLDFFFGRIYLRVHVYFLRGPAARGWILCPAAQRLASLCPTLPFSTLTSTATPQSHN